MIEQETPNSHKCWNPEEENKTQQEETAQIDIVISLISHSSKVINADTVKKAISQMKVGKAPDQSGILMEMEWPVTPVPP